MWGSGRAGQLSNSPPSPASPLAPSARAPCALTTMRSPLRLSLIRALSSPAVTAYPPQAAFPVSPALWMDGTTPFHRRAATKDPHTPLPSSVRQNKTRACTFSLRSSTRRRAGTERAPPAGRMIHARPQAHREIYAQEPHARARHRDNRVCPPAALARRFVAAAHASPWRARAPQRTRPPTRRPSLSTRWYVRVGSAGSGGQPTASPNRAGSPIESPPRDPGSLCYLVGSARLALIGRRYRLYTTDRCPPFPTIASQTLTRRQRDQLTSRTRRLPRSDTGAHAMSRRKRRRTYIVVSYLTVAEERAARGVERERFWAPLARAVRSDGTMGT